MIRLLFIKMVLEKRQIIAFSRSFGKENLFHITRDEMYHMNSNVFSIDSECGF
jgi:hypothetical protein